MSYIFKTALLVAVLSGVAQADVGGKEPGTYHSDDKDVTTYKEIDGEYYRELHRSRFDKKDPNYYWLFDKAPCLYTEIWSEKYPCPVREHEHYYGDDDHDKEHHRETKDVPEPSVVLTFFIGMLAYLWW